MSFLEDKEQIEKISSIFYKHSHNQKFLANKVKYVIAQKIKKFFSQLGLASQLFLNDLFLHLPDVAEGADLSFENCLSFLDYILFENGSWKERIEIFKMLDKFGYGYVNTNDLLLILKKNLQPWEYDQYSLILSSYGPSINYLEHFGKKKVSH